jgi:hypothetical protein
MAERKTDPPVKSPFEDSRPSRRLKPASGRFFRVTGRFFPYVE